MDTEHEEESMETESYSPQKPSTSRCVQVTPKCNQNVQVDTQSSFIHSNDYFSTYVFKIHSVPHNSNSLILNYRLFRRLPSTPNITPLTQC